MAMMKCPECGNDIQDTVEYCPYCGLVFKDANDNEKKSSGYLTEQRMTDTVSRKNNISGMRKLIIIIGLLIIGMISLIVSYRTRFSNKDYDYYTKLIKDTNNLIDKGYDAIDASYKNKQKAKALAESSTKSSIENKYNELADSFQNFIDLTYKSIDNFREIVKDSEKEKHKIEIKALILLVISIGSFISAVALIRKTKITSA